jgi:Ca-activated chloride channel family protein
MTPSKSKLFRGPRALALLAALAMTTVAAAWASRTEWRPRSTDPLPRPPALGVAAGGPVRVATRVDRGAVLLGGDGLVRMELVLAGEARAAAARAVPTDLVVLLDRSGSMSGEKIEQARLAVHELAERLGPDDRFSLVSFNGSATVDVPPQPATEPNRRAWASLIRGLGAGGGTCIRCALDTGVGLAEQVRTPGRASRVLLISDGISDADGLTGLARRAALGESVVSSIGVGLDFNEQLMTSVADAGAGNFYFLEDAATLPRVFEGELLAARATVASALEVAVEPGPGATVIDAAGYPLEREGRVATFRPGSLFAGQERSLWVTFRLPVDAPRELPLGAVRIGYRDGERPGRVVIDDLPRIACVRDESRFREELDAEVALDGLGHEALGSLQQEVAVSVAAGRRDEAARKVEDYRRQVQELVAAAPSAAPRANAMLDEAELLARTADDAFEGEDQTAKQNAFAKQNSAGGWDKRRAGAKAQPKETK